MPKSARSTFKPRVPDPPADFPKKRLSAKLSAGTRLPHFYGVAHGAGSFNPGKGAGRFHPIAAPSGTAIPTLYAGASWEGAAMETIFRTMPSDRPPTAVPRALIHRYGACLIEFRRDVHLLPLDGYNLRLLGLVRAQLLEPGPKHYSRTARWAEAISPRGPSGHRGAALVLPPVRWRPKSSVLGRSFEGIASRRRGPRWLLRRPRAREDRVDRFGRGDHHYGALR